MRSFCLTLFLVFLTVSLWGEGFVPLHGQVLDDAKHPIPGVTVRISGAVSAQTTTDTEGRFTLQVLAGKVHLSLFIDGFSPVESGLIITGAHTETFIMKATTSETVIVSASRVNTSILDSPSTGSVLPKEKIENSPAQNYADLLRSLPGINANQVSARVFRITTRQAASIGRIPTELVLVDGRTINMDLNGAASWDAIPIDTLQIKKIEVIHGPASAVWGPNAQTGVVNIISKTPAELAGSTFSLSAGILNRDVEGAPPGSNGGLFSANYTYGQILNQRFALKVSAGIFDQDAFARPIGTIPVDSGRKTGGIQYPVYENLKTTQPKFDVRLDQQLENGGTISYSGGIAWSEGTGHSSAGPVVIQPGSFIGYGKASYENGNFNTRFVANHVHLITSFDFVRNAEGGLVESSYEFQDYGLESNDSILVANHHLLTLGGNVRYGHFDLSLAPDQHTRSQFGFYLQDEFSLNRFRFVAGGRVDKFNITDAIFSPRLAAIFQPTANQSIRVSYSKAFRPPTLLEDYQNLTLAVTTLDLGQFDPALTGTKFTVRTDFVGNPQLEEETTTALEVGYTGILHEKTMLGAAFYVNRTDNIIRSITTELYSPQHLPVNWPLSPDLFPNLVYPAELSFINTGPIRYQGLELSVEHQYTAKVSVFANYTYQTDPVALNAPNPFPKNQLFEPPHHRFNVGLDTNFHPYFASANVQYVGSAFWTDVLDSRYWGPTAAFTMVNTSFGRKWMNEKVVTSINVTNLFNQQIQQHVFGDIIKRTITAQVRWIF